MPNIYAKKAGGITVYSSLWYGGAYLTQNYAVRELIGVSKDNPVTFLQGWLGWYIPIRITNIKTSSGVLVRQWKAGDLVYVPVAFVTDNPTATGSDTDNIAKMSFTTQDSKFAKSLGNYDLFESPFPNSKVIGNTLGAGYNLLVRTDLEQFGMYPVQVYGMPSRRGFITKNQIALVNTNSSPKTTNANPNTTYKDANSYWHWTKLYSIGTYNNPANIRLTPAANGAIAVANIPAGVEIWVDLRQQYWKGDWIPARIAEGKAGWVHKSVVPIEKPSRAIPQAKPSTNNNYNYSPPPKDKDNTSGGASDGEADGSYWLGAGVLLLLLTGGKSGLF